MFNFYFPVLFCIIYNFVDAQSTTSRSSPVDCKNVSYDKLDLFVVLDGSSSINSTNFQKMLDFLSNALDRLKIGPNDTRVGLLQFNHDFRLEFNLNNYSKKEELIQAIKKVEYLQGATSTGRAIQYATERGFTQQNGSRPDVPHVMLVITDGYSQDEVEEPSKLARHKGIKMLVIGISEWVNKDQLYEIAGQQDSSNVFFLEDFDSLNKILSSIVKQIQRAVNQECYDKFVATSSTEPPSTSTPTPASTLPPSTPSSTPSTTPTPPSTTSTAPIKSPVTLSNVVAATGAPSSENVVGCDEGRLHILTEALQLSKEGWVYVKGHFDDPQCRWSLSDLGKNNQSAPSLKFDQCGVQRSRSINPRGLALSTVIISMKHPQFLTKGDRAFKIQCFFLEADRTVTNSLDVNMLATEFVSRSSDMPICKYSLRADTLNGPSMRTSLIGTKVFHRWECEAGQEGQSIYGMKVHTCYVKNNNGNKKALIIDESGCVLDRYLLGNLNYSDNLLTSYSEGNVFAFADSEDLSFDCQIALCLKNVENGCSGVTPPNCAGVSRGKRSLSRFSNKNFEPAENFEVSERLFVLDDNLEQPNYEHTAVSEAYVSSIQNHYCVNRFIFAIVSLFLATLFLGSASIITHAILKPKISQNKWIVQEHCEK